jgi:two-component system LytT family sensor kinase
MRLTLLLFGCFLVGCLQAQYAKRIIPHYNGIWFSFYTRDSLKKLGQPSSFLVADNVVNGIFTFRKGLTSLEPKSTLLLGVWMSKDSAADPIITQVKSISRIYNSYRVTASSDAEVISVGINPQNVKEYRYHVVEDDSVEIVPWSPVPLSKHFGASKPFGFLGRFHRPGHILLFEVANIHQYSLRDGVLLDWTHHLQPRLTNLEAATASKWYPLNPSSNSHEFVTRFEPLSGVPLDVRFPQDSIEFLEVSLAHHETQPYEITFSKQGDSIPQQLSWWFLGETYRLNEVYFKKPGKYTLCVRAIGNKPHSDNSTLLVIPFEVYTPPAASRKYSLAQVSGYAAGFILVLAGLFLLYYLRNRRRLEVSLRDKQLATIQLKSLRSQLNPHFMFNALSSIQSLVNRQDIPRAGQYLSTFAGLTRKVLLAGDQELISLEDELQILDDYLKMEQLRFGFEYILDIASDLPMSNIDVPSMLLQPYVENAVKHGVSALGAEGLVLVSVSQSGRDLVLTVRDNGPGINADLAAESGGSPLASSRASAAARSSFGLKLGQDRIALLNQIYPEQGTILSIDTGTSGTLVTIVLNNWIQE